MSNPAHGSGKKGRRSKLRGLVQSQAITRSWAEVEIIAMGRLVVAVSSAGCAVLFGHTRDGGALSLSFYDGTERETYYCGGSEDATDWLLDHLEYWENQNSGEKGSESP